MIALRILIGALVVVPIVFLLGQAWLYPLAERWVKSHQRAVAKWGEDDGE